MRRPGYRTRRNRTLPDGQESGVGYDRETAVDMVFIAFTCDSNLGTRYQFNTVTKHIPTDSLQHLAFHPSTSLQHLPSHPQPRARRTEHVPCSFPEAPWTRFQLCTVPQLLRISRTMPSGALSVMFPMNTVTGGPSGSFVRRLWGTWREGWLSKTQECNAALTGSPHMGRTQRLLQTVSNI